MSHRLTKTTAALVCSLGLVVAGPPATASSDGKKSDKSKEAAESAPEDVSYDVVDKQQTLGTLALEHGVSVEQLMGWNDLDLGEAEAGMKLIVSSDEETDQEGSGDPLPVIHVIKKGDTLGSIAEQYHVSLRQVKRWNRGLNPRLLQLGDRVRLYVPGRNGKSVSWGAASNGRLYNGVPLKTTVGLDVRSVAHAYGTARTVRLLQAAAADVQARWPDSPDLVVGHLSYKNGGHMRPHKSHQSGRDADLSFYLKGNVQLPNLWDTPEQLFDARKNWHLFKTLMDTEEVQFIFVSYYLQEKLYKYARSIGYTKEQLKPLLQYPRSKYQPVGVIRHAAGHDDHFHIRFDCGPKDRHCR
jgi:LysM repeat protein